MPHYKHVHLKSNIAIHNDIMKRNPRSVSNNRRAVRVSTLNFVPEFESELFCEVRERQNPGKKPGNKMVTPQKICLLKGAGASCG